MNDKTKPGNRIPYESLVDADVVSSWSLPSVEKKSRMVFNAKREQEKSKKQQGSEIVEDYKGVVKPKPLTADDLKKLTDEAKKEGFDQGYQEGLAKGTQEGSVKGEKAGHTKAYSETKQRLNDEIQRLNHISSNLLAPMDGQEQALENIIVDMAINFTKELLQVEVQQQPTALLNLVRNALMALPVGSKNITVYVNDDDTQLINTHLPQEQRDWALQIDNSVTTGGCRIETHESLIDYTCEHRLREFLKQIRDQGDVSEDSVAPVPEFERPEQALPSEDAAPPLEDAAPQAVDTTPQAEGDASPVQEDASSVSQNSAASENSEIPTPSPTPESNDRDPQHFPDPDAAEPDTDTPIRSPDDHAE